jgi:hypothetical protein
MRALAIDDYEFDRIRPMALETISVRLEPAEIERLDAIAKVLAERAAGASISRSNALRVVVQAGLEALETQFKAKSRR